MANWTEKDLLQKGMVRNSDGTYSREIAGKTYTRKSPNSLYTKEDLTAHSETIINNNIAILPPLASVITIPGIVAGLNGSKGLMRSHWTTIKKQKELYCKIITDHFRENKARKHPGEVTVEYIGYKSILMDWDNFVSSFKHIGDGLRDMGVIVDDKPSIITQFIPAQIKCKRADQKVVIIIKDK